MPDACLIKAEIVENGLAPGSDEQMAALEHGLAAITMPRERDAHRTILARYRGDFRVRIEADPLAAQLRFHHFREFAILTGEDVLRLDHADPRAQPGMGLSEFEPDRAAADHDEMAGPLREFEDRFIGMMGRLGKPPESAGSRGGRRWR